MRIDFSAWSIVLAISVLATTEAAANDAVHVIRLRSVKLSLYDQPNGAKVDELDANALAQPWPVSRRLPNGFLEVETPKGRFWVKQYAVQTDEKLVAPAECGVVLAGTERRTGVTRGLGEECRQ